jgi:hypothetical protein
MVSSPKFFLSWFLILLALLFFACTHVAGPDRQIPVSMDIVGPIIAHNEISLVNNQNKRLELVSSGLGHKCYVNYQQWTEFIVNQLKEELEKRGVKVNPESDIVFRVSVQDLKFYSGTFAARCVVKVLVGRPDIAWSNIYEGNYVSMSDERYMNGATYRAVEAILGDRGFQKALSREYQEKVEEEAVSEEDVVEKLKQLKEMKEKGLITEEEYQNKKKEILEEF